jgi:hypothetical protein
MANPGCLAALRRLWMPAAAAPGFAGPSYRLRDDFVSPAELSFYRVLRDALGARYVIAPKVSLGDLFYAPHPDRGRALGLMNRIDRKHVDLLLCDPDTLAPLAGIELDDASHRRPRRAERDRLVEGVFREAGLPLLRLRVRHAYHPEDLAALVDDALATARREDAPPPAADDLLEDSPAPEMAADEPPASDGRAEDLDPLAFYTPTYRPPEPGAARSSSSPVVEVAEPPPSRAASRSSSPPAAPRWSLGDEPPLCPRCGREMVLRTAKGGRHKGSAFWGCPSFPKCRMILRFDPSPPADDLS